MELIRLDNICKTYHLGEVDVPVLNGIDHIDALKAAGGEHLLVSPGVVGGRCAGG